MNSQAGLFDDEDKGDSEADALLARLAALVARHTAGEGLLASSLAGLRLGRSSRPTEPLFQLQEPSIHVIVQGRKQVVFGGEVMAFGPSQYLAASVDVIAAAQIVEASPERPYLAISLDLAPQEIGALLLEAGASLPREHTDARGLFLSRLELPLMDALLRLLKLLDTPGDVRFMAPLIWKEIYFRLLQGEQAGRLAQIAIGGSRTQRVARAVAWLKQNFAAPLRIEALAREVNVSPSSLHHQFKAVTAMSPLQFQKSLRLHEGRRLMLVEGRDVTNTAFEVGYESSSQFIREYARFHGAPPLRDIKRVRAAFQPVA